MGAPGRAATLLLLIPPPTAAFLTQADPATGEIAYDEKNIRRRVYDALNVLMALGVIEKDKKQIFWKGMRTTRESDVERARAERRKVLDMIDRKQRFLTDLIAVSRARIAQHGTARPPAAAPSPAPTGLTG